MKQEQALNILKMGQNVFLTGRAGAGKTYVLNKYVEYLKEKHIPVAITASTGIAATHLGGTTIHSWSGMGIKDEITEQDIKKLLKKSYLKKHYLGTSVLIIDEVSMLHAHQLDLVNQLCQIFRKDLRPFGGMQIVLSGDFFQLPPVAKYGQKAKFIIESNIWQSMNPRICYLDEQFRQDDVHFINILNEIRSGQVSRVSRDLLNQKINQNFDFYIEPTKLYTHNVDVDEMNLKELDKIKNKPKQYEMTYSGRKNIVEILKKTCLVPENLILKVGAKVMFVKNNFEVGVVNGTLGEVIGFDKFTDYPQVRIKSGKIIFVKPDVWIIEEGEKKLAEIRQFPLRLAWAITIHKSQGMSLDLAEIDLSKAFTPGMGYVALSRVRNLEGLKLKGFNSMALEVNSQILIFDKTLQTRSVNNFKLLKEISDQEIQERQDKFVQDNLVQDIFQKKEKKKPNKLETLELIKQGLSLEKIAKKEGLKQITIVNHLEKLIADEIQIDIEYLMPKKTIYKKIEKGFNKCGLEKLKPVYEYLKEKYSYDDLKLVRLNMKNLK
ncbi:AAA family ATPase [bacterium]|nr:AAA family ATPase [bacterium]